jgi:hypothetical protein
MDPASHAVVVRPGFGEDPCECSRSFVLAAGRSPIFKIRRDIKHPEQVVLQRKCFTKFFLITCVVLAGCYLMKKGTVPRLLVQDDVGVQCLGHDRLESC